MNNNIFHKRYDMLCTTTPNQTHTRYETEEYHGPFFVYVKVPNIFGNMIKKINKRERLGRY